MTHDWTESSVKNFRASSQRARFLNCDAQLNPPRHGTKLYAVQVLPYKKAAAYATEPASLLVLANSDAFYLVSTSDFANVVGFRASGRRADDEGLARHFNKTPEVWRSSGDARKIVQFAVRDLEHLYTEVVRRCRPGGLSHSLMAQDLATSLPGPQRPEGGVAFGTPFYPTQATTESEIDETAGVTDQAAETKHDRAGPPSRRGGCLQRGGGSSKGRAAGRSHGPLSGTD